MLATEDKEQAEDALAAMIFAQAKRDARRLKGQGQLKFES